MPSHCQIIDKESRSKILKVGGGSFSDIHTIVTYVIKPNGYDIFQLYQWCWVWWEGQRMDCGTKNIHKRWNTIKEF